MVTDISVKSGFYVQQNHLFSILDITTQPERYYQDKTEVGGYNTSSEFQAPREGGPGDGTLDQRTPMVTCSVAVLEMMQPIGFIANSITNLIM